MCSHYGGCCMQLAELTLVCVACQQAAAPRTEAVVNYMALPQPVKYEEIQKEALSESV